MSHESSGNRRQDPETYVILGAAMEVHRQLGRGFLEGVYQEALSIELADRGIPTRREVTIPVHYKGTQLTCGYRADFVCFDSVLLELKALDKIGDNEIAQVLNYLRGTGLRRALLINFGTRHLEYRRIVFDPQ